MISTCTDQEDKNWIGQSMGLLDLGQVGPVRWQFCQARFLISHLHLSLSSPTSVCLCLSLCLSLSIYLSIWPPTRNFGHLRSGLRGFFMAFHHCPSLPLFMSCPIARIAHCITEYIVCPSPGVYWFRKSATDLGPRSHMIASAQYCFVLNNQQLPESWGQLRDMEGRGREFWTWGAYTSCLRATWLCCFLVSCPVAP